MVLVTVYLVLIYLCYTTFESLHDEFLTTACCSKKGPQRAAGRLRRKNRLEQRHEST